MKRAVYLYGFVPREISLPVEGLQGVGDEPVRLLDLGSFRAVVSAVAEELADPESLAERMTDLAWVARHGLEHERVVAWFVDHASILPVRLLTLYSSEQALVASVAERREAVQSTLERFGGSREWDLKISYDAERLAGRLGEVSEEIATLDAAIAAAAPGRRFLLEKKRTQLARAEVVAAAHRLAQALLAELTPEAAAVVVLASPRSGAELPVILNAALLVEIAREAGLVERVRARSAELAAVGVDVQFSGPWAPYRFIESENERGAAHMGATG